MMELVHKNRRNVREKGNMEEMNQGCDDLEMGGVEIVEKSWGMSDIVSRSERVELRFF